MPKVLIKFLDPRWGADWPRPCYQTADAAGFDLRAAIDAPMMLVPGQRCTFPTGLALAIESGWEGQVRPRSGLAHREGLTVLNAPGTVDADFRDEVGVILINLGRALYRVEPGERIAQMVIAPAVQAELESVAGELPTPDSLRSGGFGHSGRF